MEDVTHATAEAVGDKLRADGAALACIWPGEEYVRVDFQHSKEAGEPDGLVVMQAEGVSYAFRADDFERAIEGVLKALRDG